MAKAIQYLASNLRFAPSAAVAARATAGAIQIWKAGTHVGLVRPLIGVVITFVHAGLRARLRRRNRKKLRPDRWRTSAREDVRRVGRSAPREAEALWPKLASPHKYSVSSGPSCRQPPADLESGR